jgi:VanZ family protein
LNKCGQKSHFLNGEVPIWPNFVKILYKLPAVCIAAGIWFLSSQSTLPQIKGVLGWDKLQHLLAYGALSVAAALWVSPAFQKRRPLAALLVTALAASIYGVTDELHQFFVPGRSCNFWDWLADTVGALLGATAAHLVLLRLRYVKKNYDNS